MAARPRITLDQLHTFVAVADHEHVTGAAEALRQSQGSVSAAITRLEAALGLPLFHRVGRNVRLTDVGRAVRFLAVRALDEAQQVERLARGYAAFELGEITIASGRVTGAHLLARWLAPFVREHPHIDVRLQLAPLQDLMAMLHSGASDVVLLGAAVSDDDVDVVTLERTELVLVVAAQHPLANRPAPMRELLEHRHLAHDPGTATHALARELLGDPAVRLALVLDETALHAALLAGLGYAAMPRAAVERELLDGTLVELPRPGRPVHQEFRAARRRGLATPAADAFWRHLVAMSAPVSASRVTPAPR